MRRCGSPCSRRSFTLVELMIVVAIIALLAAIAIPNLLLAKVAANDSVAKGTLRTLSTSSETFASANNGSYPANLTALINVTPPYVTTDFCDGAGHDGFTFDCSGMSTSGYTITATPVNVGVSGTTTYTITTGGLLQ